MTKLLPCLAPFAAAVLFSCTSGLELPPKPEISSSSLGSGSSSSFSGNVSSPSGSSSSVGAFEDCSLLVPNFACSWNPVTVEAGDSSVLNLQMLSSPTSGMSCSPKAWLLPLYGDTVHFALGQKIMTSGESWPRSGSFVVNGTLVCTSTERSCHRTLPCAPLTITPAPPPDSSSINLSCSWPTLPEGTNNLAKGTALTTCTLTGSIPNANARCETPTIEYCGGSTPSSCDASRVGTITVKAVAACKGGEYDLKTLTYNVREDYNIGTCVWDKNRYIVRKNDIATPSINITNNYGRCNTAFNNGLPRKVELTDTAGLSATATVNCSTGSNTVICPAVDVIDSLYEIKGKGYDNRLTNLPNGKIIVSVNPTSLWWGSDSAYVSGNANNTTGGSGSCQVKVTPILPSGCSGTKMVTLSGQTYLGRMSIGKPTCTRFELQLESSNCIQLLFYID